MMQKYLERIEAYLNNCFLEDEPQKILFEAMRYSLLAGGKRLRPIFVLAFCDLCGGDTEKAMPFAAAVEMIHTSSLIHDDLPCMDNDDFRRGKPTNHKVYGEATACLAGDALIITSFGQLASADLPPERIAEGVRVLSACVGELGMVGGQILDMDAEHRLCTPQEVYDIQSRKTGALISAACQLGVIAAGGTMEQQNAAAQYAEHLGLAFQIRDDILDVIGDAEKLGKATGTDENKNTFVRLYGVEKCESMVADETQKAIDALACFDRPDFLTSIAKQLIDREN